MNTKGSLQLSVGAIITLIIAVALLGLVISFVATQFSFFSGKIALNEVTPEPTPSNAITLPGGRNSLELSKNTEYEMIVKVYNSGSAITAMSGVGGNGDPPEDTSLDLSSLVNPVDTSQPTLVQESLNFCAEVGGTCGSNENTDIKCPEIHEYDTDPEPDAGVVVLKVIGTATSENKYYYEDNDRKCEDIGCGAADGAGVCTNGDAADEDAPDGEPGQFTLSCANASIGDLSLSVPPTPIGAGSIGEVPVLVKVNPTASVGKTPCTFSIGTAKKSLFVTVE